MSCISKINFDVLLRRLSDVAESVDGPVQIAFLYISYLGFPMFYYVYLIRSINQPSIVYIGYTTNLKNRLEAHNSGGSIYTRKDRPWELVVGYSL